jgi:hypothetical protein
MKASAKLLVACGCLIWIAFSLACGSGGDNGTPTPTIDVEPGNGLVLYSHREHLGICIEEGTGSSEKHDPTDVEKRLVQMIEDEVLPQFETHWAWAELVADTPPRVTAGCGVKASVFERLDEGAALEEIYASSGRLVEVPNENLVLMFVVEKSDLERLRVDEEYLYGVAEEYTGGGHVFQTGTYGIYLTKEAATNPETLEFLLRETTGLTEEGPENDGDPST